jgi:glycosyltransferase involved in cell wall biosynthesis
VNLSIAIISKNEAARIRGCLESVSWADEIVVLDSGSNDETLEICREYTDKVFVNDDWQGFGVQKNRVLDLCSGRWILSLDADERVTSELRGEIEQIVAAESAIPYPIYELPRLSRYCGREMRHGGWWPDYVARLFYTGSARFSEDLVHERLIYDSEAGRLIAPLKHHSFDSLEQVLDKVDRYSTAGAQRLFEQGKRGSLSKAVIRSLWSFLRTWIFRMGFLDGREGFMLAVSNAEGTYYKYLKLYLLQREAKVDSNR